MRIQSLTLKKLVSLKTIPYSNNPNKDDFPYRYLF